jgi:hypothetical protein
VYFSPNFTACWPVCCEVFFFFFFLHFLGFFWFVLTIICSRQIIVPGRLCWFGGRLINSSLYIMEHKIDLLLELPNPVVEHIQSFIPLKKIPQLSTLSKRWQKVWTLFPIPQFNSKFYDSNLYKISGNKKKRKIKIKSEEFNYFVERTFVSRCRQNLRINKFNLKIWVMDETDYIVANRWIGFAIESNVKELNLGLNPMSIALMRGLTSIRCLRVF